MKSTKSPKLQDHIRDFLAKKWNFVRSNSDLRNDLVGSAKICRITQIKGEDIVENTSFSDSGRIIRDRTVNLLKGFPAFSMYNL